MSKRDPAILLDDILAAVAKIGRYTAGYSREQFLGDEKTADAVVRNLEVVGEAVKQLPEPFKEQHAAVPWRKMAALRNRIAHDYAGVDLEIVWAIVRESLPELQRQLVQLLEPE